MTQCDKEGSTLQERFWSWEQIQMQREREKYVPKVFVLLTFDLEVSSSDSSQCNGRRYRNDAAFVGFRSEY